jgi:hypothetical protein
MPGAGEPGDPMSFVPSAEGMPSSSPMPVLDADTGYAGKGTYPKV